MGSLVFWIVGWIFLKPGFIVSLFYLWFGGSPDLPFWSLGWSPVSRLGPAHPGLIFVTRPGVFPARQGLTPLGSFFFGFVMALRALRRTVSLDVSELARSHDRKTVSESIVDHFVGHNVHAVQFIGTVAKVTFAVEASKQEVLSHQAINIKGIQCAVRGGGPRAQNVLIYNYPVGGPEDLVRNALRIYGVVEEVKFRHWPHMPEVGDGVRIVRMVRNTPIPRHMHIGEVRVKVAYAGQQQVCDMCETPGHIARNCPHKNKCFSCHEEGHLARNCPRRQIRRDRDEVVTTPDPTPAEAAVLAAGAAAHVVPVTSMASLSADTDSLEGVSLSSAAGVPTVDPASDIEIDPPATDATPDVGPTPSPSPDLRDNQLDELASQPLLPSPSPSNTVDSLQGVTVESAYLDSPTSPSPPGQGAPTIGLFDKIKSKVGLNKKKASTVNVNSTGACVNQNESSNQSSNENSDVINVSKSNTCSNNTSNGNTCSNPSKKNNANPNSKASSQILSEHEYIGQGVLAGREKDSDMVLAVESQKRSHPDSDSVDSVDEDSFVVPVALPPRPSKKKPAVVVSPGTVRPGVVDSNSNRDRSRSPKRSPSASRSSASGAHSLPSGLGYQLKPPRSPSASRGPRSK